MIDSLLKRLSAVLKKPAETPAPSDPNLTAFDVSALASARPEPEALRAPSPEPARIAPPALAQLDETAVRTRLKSELHLRYLSLIEHLPPPMQVTDVPAVLNSLLDEGESAIRQPPIAAQRALSAARREDVNRDQLVDLVSNDPGLAQELLKAANSAFYAVPDQPVVSLDAAVGRVGTRGVENVVLSHLFGSTFCKPGAAYETLVRQVWNHMVRSAPIARRLAPSYGLDPEYAFSLGLLHDAGKLVLFERISQFRHAWRREVNVPQHFLLWALRKLHEPVSGLAALEWGLGHEAAWAIAHHHRDPAPAGADPASEVLFLAERLDLAQMRGTTPDLAAWWSEGRLSGTPERIAGETDGLERAA